MQYAELKESIVELEVNNLINVYFLKFLYIQLLGKGSFGSVCKIFSKKTGKFYAIKNASN